MNLALRTANNSVANNYLKHTERTELANARRECYVAKSQDACNTAMTLELKDKATTDLIKNAVVTCKGAEECWNVLSYINQFMNPDGTPLLMDPKDAEELKALRMMALQKAENAGLEPVYPESWLLDAKAVLDIGKLGFKLIAGATAKSSLETLQLLSKTNLSKLKESYNTSFEFSNVYAKQVGGRPVILGGTIDNPGIVWGKGIGAQGYPWEKTVTNGLSKNAIDLNEIKPNFKAFDNFDEGVAISAKTLDTNAPSYVKSPSSIYSTLKDYVNKMDKFTVDGNDTFRLTNQMIERKEMQLAIPANTSPIAMNKIELVQAYALKKGINIVITKIK
jgi:hypothetical protein